ncbi:unnamed protein product [Trichobilharzia szidati]|nr:unnamed protein product [Trichobilharzia szidati]
MGRSPATTITRNEERGVKSDKVTPNVCMLNETVQQTAVVVASTVQEALNHFFTKCTFRRDSYQVEKMVN